MAVVPDVVGLTFSVGRQRAVDAEVALANPDPDGPPIGALAWPGVFRIVAQHPAPGAEIARWGSVAIEIEPLDGEGDRSHADPDRPGHLEAHAEPDSPPHVVDVAEASPTGPRATADPGSRRHDR